jgi:hypothetical protein
MPGSTLLLLLRLLLVCAAAMGYPGRARAFDFDSSKLPHGAGWSVLEKSTAWEVLLLNVENRRPAEQGERSLSGLLVLYYSRHFGTVQDFAAVAQGLGLTWSHLTPGQFCSGYSSGVDDATECFSKISYACDIFDVIFVGDISSDGFPLLNGG